MSAGNAYGVTVHRDEEDLSFEVDAPETDLLSARAMYEQIGQWKAEKRVLDAKIAGFKGGIEKMVEMYGNLKLGDKVKGQVKSVGSGHSYPKAKVDELVDRLLVSSDPVEQAVGQKVVDLRTLKAGYEYFDLR